MALHRQGDVKLLIDCGTKRKWSVNAGGKPRLETLNGLRPRGSKVEGKTGKAGWERVWSTKPLWPAGSSSRRGAWVGMCTWYGMETAVWQLELTLTPDQERICI